MREIRCSNRCGFRVHERYFYDKRSRFTPTSCPRCSAGEPVVFVDGVEDPSALFVTDPADAQFGLIR